MHDLALASQPPPPFKDELTEAKRGPYTKSLHSKESQGWKPGPKALACLAVLPLTPWLAHSGLPVKAGWASLRGGPVGPAP